MKYTTLAELKEAFGKGELDREKHMVDVDNDAVYLYLSEEEDYSDEAVFRFRGRPEELLIEALKLLGIPAGHV